MDQQETYVKIYKTYLQLRDEVMESSEETSLPGHYTGPVCPKAAGRGPAKGCSTTTGDGWLNLWLFVFVEYTYLILLKKATKKSS